MLESIDLLRERIALQALLASYEARRNRDPKVEWQDREMALDGADEQDLCSMHGILLATGWLDVRVHAEAFAHAGELRGAYRITDDGIRALRYVEDPYDLAEEAPAGAW